MINPLRSEAEAFRFLIGAIVYFAAIVIATTAGGRWVGVGVFLGLTAAIAVWWARSRRAYEGQTRTAPRPHAEGERRILVIANETVGGEPLLELLRRKAEDVEEHVLVVTPALNSQLRHWTSDEDGARAAAQARLDASLRRLADEGVDARGEVGDGDPLQAMEDALRTFGADEIVISTHPEGRSHWLARGILEKARERFDGPITHVVVDLEAEQGADR